MSVLIAELPFVNGAMKEFQVFPDRVRSHLMIIASASQTDFDDTFGDVPFDENGDGTVEWSRVLYAPAVPSPPTTDGERVKTNFKALVDQAAPAQLYGVGWDWILSRSGDTGNSTPGIQLGRTVIYDTTQANGAGRWFTATDGSKKCVLDAEILYHELIHVLKGHGGTIDPAAAEAEEREARVEEGALERALGRPARDPDRPQAGVGCQGEGPCCIVATVAAGSPYAAEVNRLRAVRDQTLRGTALGEAWFSDLHREYYRFSVPIARTMVRDETARRTVARWFVEPFVDALEAAVLWAGTDDDGALGTDIVRRAAGRDPELAEQWPLVDEVLASLAEGDGEALARLPLDPSMAGAFEPLMRCIPTAPNVNWALVELLRRWGDVSVRATAHEDTAAVGAAWAAHMEAWIGCMPLFETDEGRNLAVSLRRSQLDELARDLLTSASARRALAVLAAGPERSRQP